jgi:starch synthase
MVDAKLRVVVMALDDGGGMRHYAENLGAAMRGFCEAETVLICHDDGLDHASAAGRWLDRLPKGERLRRMYNPRRARRLADGLLRRCRPHVVHLSSTVPCGTALARHLQRAGTKVVLTVHDVEPHEEHRSAWSRLHSFAYQRWARPAALRQPDALHVHSELHRADLRRCFGAGIADSAYVVPHGGGLTDAVRHGSRRPQELDAAGVGEGYALFFGRIHPYKGLPVLFDAALRLMERMPDFRLVVAGGGSLPEVPAPLRARSVLINRFIADDEIAALVRGARCVVLPYVRATQTGVVPLAAALGRPAIVTTAGSLADLVIDGTTGLVVPAGDAPALADGLERLAGDAERAASMGAAAFAHMHANFAWPAVAAAHAAAYARLTVMGRGGCA